MFNMFLIIYCIYYDLITLCLNSNLEAAEGSIGGSLSFFQQKQSNPFIHAY
jgi:hypothetical protein